MPLSKEEKERYKELESLVKIAVKQKKSADNNSDYWKSMIQKYYQEMETLEVKRQGKRFKAEDYNQ